MSPRIVLGLGSNLGDRRATIERAVVAVAELPDTILLARSGLWETDPVGGPPQQDFYNAAVLVASALPPLSLLDRLLDIERQFGRVRSVPNGPRTLDIDILWLEGLTLCHPRLELPHPRLHERAFALAPMLEVASDARDPRSGVLYAEMLAQLGTGNIRPLRAPLDAPSA
jgi:2-amino-4-hydroxy-6-hydroxymethyldihydropteridine diphosphokinase